MLARTRDRRTRQHSTPLTLLTMLTLVLLEVAPTVVRADTGNPAIVPPESHPHGRTYGEWAARWWQWALGQPNGVNPILDPTGARCAEGQTGDVWFLGGSFASGPVNRTCTVPRGKSLFFPLLNSAFFAFLNDPPEQRTEEFLRAKAACSVPSQLSASIDGVAVNNPLQYHEESPLFDVQLPADNVFGLTPDVAPQLLLSPSVDQGYYLFVAPLSPGQHTLRWQGTWNCQDTTFTENVRYTLTIPAKGLSIQFNNANPLNIKGSEQPQIVVQFGNQADQISNVRVVCVWDNRIRFNQQVQTGPFPNFEQVASGFKGRPSLFFPKRSVTDEVQLPDLPPGQNYNLAFGIRLQLPSPTFKGEAGTIQCFLLNRDFRVLAESQVLNVNVR